jgi:hypothetical protein
MRSPRPVRRTVVTLVNQLFFAGALGFGVVELVHHRARLSTAVSDIGVWATVASLVLAVAGVALSSQVWRSALRALGARPQRLASERVFFTTQVGKYLPGLVWPYAAQLRFASRLGLSKPQMLVAQVVFLATHVVTGIAMGALALPLLILDGRVAAATAWLIVPALGCLAVLYPRLLTAVVNRLRRGHGKEIEVDGREIVVAAAYMVATWLLYGTSTALLAVPLTSSFGEAYTLSLGGFAVAWVVGFLVLVAPAGVGPREVALIAILSIAMTRSEAAGVAVLSRALMTAADLLLAVGAVVLLRTKKTDPSVPPGHASDRTEGKLGTGVG